MSKLQLEVNPAIPAGSAHTDPGNVGAYPYLVVRINSVVYQREDIAIRRGPSSVHIGPHCSHLQHSEPFKDNEGISEDCKALLIAGVIEAVRRTGFQMCIVWGPDSCTYCKKDGSANDSNILPSGGMGSGGVGGRPLPIDIDFSRRVPFTEV